MSLRQGSATAYGSVVLNTSRTTFPGALPLATHLVPFQGKEKNLRSSILFIGKAKAIREYFPDP